MTISLDNKETACKAMGGMRNEQESLCQGKCYRPQHILNSPKIPKTVLGDYSTFC